MFSRFAFATSAFAPGARKPGPWLRCPASVGASYPGFTPLSEELKPAEVVRLLDRLFSRFDDLAEHLGVEKLKTIGDAYMAVAGAPSPRPDHAQAIVELARQ